MVHDTTPAYCGNGERAFPSWLVEVPERGIAPARERSNSRADSPVSSLPIWRLTAAYEVRRSRPARVKLACRAALSKAISAFAGGLRYGSRSSLRTAPANQPFADSPIDAYSVRIEGGTRKRMSQRPSKLLGSLLAVLLAWSLPMQGQEPDADGSGSGYTVEQSDAIDRVDELVGRLQAMPWGPEVVEALSTLGTAACPHNQELGVRAFETAYSVVAGLDFDSDDDWSMRTLSQLAAAAPTCDPSFRERPLTAQIPAAKLRTQGLLDATLDSVSTDPQKATEFARGVASQVHTLPSIRQRFFVRALQKLRQQLPADADRHFRNALSSVAATGTMRDLFALGNYVFGADPAPDTAAAMTRVPGGSAYLFSVVRSGLSNELANEYVGTAIEMLLTRGTPATLDSEALALAIQLASWSKTNAPEHSSTLESLLAAQPDLLGIRETLSDFKGHAERMDSVSNLEEELKSAIDETSKSRLRFQLCMNRIRNGKFSQAEDLLDDLRPELRRILRDFIGLQRASETIANDSLEAAMIEVAGLKDSLHQVLGGLSLATAYWSRSTDATSGSEEDRQAADRALRHATGAAEGVPDHLRPHCRIAVAAVLAKCDQAEEALRVLELALQELGTDQSHDETEEEEFWVSVTPHPWGGFRVVIRDGYGAHSQDLHPHNLAGANFEQAIHHLSLSPEMDLDRLDAVASMAVHPRMRAEGLVAVATGALARAFNTGTE